VRCFPFLHIYYIFRCPRKTGGQSTAAFFSFLPLPQMGMLLNQGLWAELLLHRLQGGRNAAPPSARQYYTSWAGEKKTGCTHAQLPTHKTRRPTGRATWPRDTYCRTPTCNTAPFRLPLANCACAHFHPTPTLPPHFLHGTTAMRTWHCGQRPLQQGQAAWEGVGQSFTFSSLQS